MKAHQQMDQAQQMVQKDVFKNEQVKSTNVPPLLSASPAQILDRPITVRWANIACWRYRYSLLGLSWKQFYFSSLLFKQ
jgi:hypothetical protein